MKYILFITLWLLAGCKRFKAEQIVLTARYGGWCEVATNVVDKEGRDGEVILYSYYIPCDQATDSSRSADFKKAQNIVDQLNKCK